MGWLSNTILIIVLILYVMTFMTEPMLTLEFSKEMVKSGGKLVIKIKEFIQGLKEEKTIVEGG